MTKNPDTTWHEIVMWRDNLNDLPHETDAQNWQLPDGFSLRDYQSGDNETWTQIHRRADPFNSFDEEIFTTIFGTDEAVLAQRQRFLIAPDGTAIGTATAWFEDAELGRVHWVAIVPEYQNRGLGRALLAETLRLLRDLEHGKAVLSTDSRRQNAVEIYRRAGFVEVNC